MAIPIKLESRHQDAQAELRRRLDEAPTEHAEALLAAYDVLQGLHDRGILDALKGALSASDFILGQLVATANTPETIRDIRNLLVFGKALGEIEPEVLARFAGVLPEALTQMPDVKASPPGLVSILQKFNSPDCRRAMSFYATLLESLGKRLGGS